MYKLNLLNVKFQYSSKSMKSAGCREPSLVANATDSLSGHMAHVSNILNFITKLRKVVLSYYIRKSMICNTVAINSSKGMLITCYQGTLYYVNNFIQSCIRESSF